MKDSEVYVNDQLIELLELAEKPLPEKLILSQPVSILRNNDLLSKSKPAQAESRGSARKNKNPRKSLVNLESKSKSKIGSKVRFSQVLTHNLDPSPLQQLTEEEEKATENIQ